jgi:hypothetical protein
MAFFAAVTTDHLTPQRTADIVKENTIRPLELAHVSVCASCNGWLRAFAALASSAGNPIQFEIPPAPETS